MTGHPSNLPLAQRLALAAGVKDSGRYSPGSKPVQRFTRYDDSQKYFAQSREGFKRLGGGGCFTTRG